jgi:hypothetical protein
LAMANFRWIGPCHFGFLGAMKVQRRAMPACAPLGQRRPGASAGDGFPKVGHGQLYADQELHRFEFVDSMGGPEAHPRSSVVCALSSGNGSERQTSAPRWSGLTKVGHGQLWCEWRRATSRLSAQQGSGAVTQATRPVASSLSRRSGTGARTSGGWIGLAVASGTAKVGHGQLPSRSLCGTWIQRLLDALGWCPGRRLRGWLWAPRRRKSRALSGWG